MGYFSTVNSWDSSPVVEKGVFDIEGGLDGFRPTTLAGGGVGLKAMSVVSRSLSPVDCFELSVSFRRAVEARARNACQATGRCFTRSGREITGGPLMRLLRRPSPGVSLKRFVYDWASFMAITGERAAEIVMGEGGVPAQLQARNPLRLEIDQPTTTPRDRAEVSQWRYAFPGTAKPHRIPDTRLLFDRSFTPNPDSPVRGLSPAVTGCTHAEIGYFSALYNKTFFQNNTRPDGMLVLPEGTPKSQRDDFERRWLEQFRSDHHRHNWHKQFVVSGGKELRYEPLDQTFQDGAFMDAQRWADEKIGQLLGVPPIEMHNLQKTRFDTANEERKMFAESTVIPDLEQMAEAIQMQLIDPYFALSEYSTEKSGRMSKSLERLFEKARAARGEGDVIFIFDVDTMPIMGAVKAAMVETAGKFREVTMASPKETNEFFKIELVDENEKNAKLREDIWIPNNVVNASNPAMNAQLVPGVKPAGEAGGDKPPAEKKPAPKKELTPEQRRQKQALKTAIHKLRTLTLKRMADDRLWTNAETDGLACGDPVLTNAIQEARFHIRRIIGEHDDKQKQIDGVKAYLDSLDAAYLKKMLGL